LAAPQNDALAKRPSLLPQREGLKSKVGSWNPPTSKPNQDRSQVGVTDVADAPGQPKRISRNMRCQACGRALVADEPVWRRKVSLGKSKLKRWRYVLKTHCEQCKSDLVSYRRAAPCEGCGRPVHDEALRHRTVCSTACARKAAYADARQRRAEARWTVNWASCGQRFTPKRAGSRFCSDDCRVTAWRKHKRVAP
jgi:predicted nucleic acid-binding Zn ribbon protein